GGALAVREIRAVGDGSRLRDFVHVDEGVEAFRRAGAAAACAGGVFNGGGGEPISHRELVALLIDVAGSGRVKFVEWPPHKKRIDIGSFYSDSTRFRQTTGWKPAIALRDGLAATVAFYREHLAQYVDAPVEAIQEMP